MALGTTLAFVIHLTAGWPMSHLMPVAVVGALINATPFSFAQGLHIFKFNVVFLLVGGLIAWSLTPWPFFLMLACIYMLYRLLVYLFSTDETLLVIVSALIGFTVVPILSSLYPGLGLVFGMGLIMDFGVALLIAPIAWLLVPLNAPPPEEDHGEPLSAPNSPTSGSGQASGNHIAKQKPRLGTSTKYERGLPCRKRKQKDYPTRSKICRWRIGAVGKSCWPRTRCLKTRRS